MKRIVSLLLAVLTVLSFTACHKAKRLEPFAIPDKLDTTRQFELTFWAKNDTNKVQSEIYRKTIEDFQTLYPNIRVNLKLYTDYGTIFNDVNTNLLTGTTPNVCITYPDHIATYLAGDNTVVPLDALFADEKYGLGGSELLFDGPTQQQIIPQFLKECIVNGNYYALPYMRSTESCYVNKTMVEKLGFTLPETLTWDFVWEVSEAAMKKDAQGNFLANGQKVLIPFIYKSTDNMMIQLLRQHKAGYSTETGEVKIFHDTTTQILLEISEHARTGAFSTFKRSSYPANKLNRGQCIFAIDSTAGATWMGCKAPLLDVKDEELVEFETVVMPIPQVDPENPVMISQGPSVCIFNKEDPQEVLASWLFAQYLLTNEVQIAYSQTEGYVPVTSKAQESDQYQDYLSRCGEDNNLYYDIKIQAAQLLLNNTDHTFVTPVFNGSTSLRDTAGELIEDVVLTARQKKPVDAGYIQTLYENVAARNHLDEIVPVTGEVTKFGNKVRLGKLPTESVLLLVCLSVAWVCMGIYVLGQKIKNRRNAKKH